MQNNKVLQKLLAVSAVAAMFSAFGVHAQNIAALDSQGMIGRTTIDGTGGNTDSSGMESRSNAPDRSMESSGGSGGGAASSGADEQGGSAGGGSGQSGTGTSGTTSGTSGTGGGTSGTTGGTSGTTGGTSGGTSGTTDGMSGGTSGTVQGGSSTGGSMSGQGTSGSSTSGQGTSGSSGSSASGQSSGSSATATGGAAGQGTSGTSSATGGAASQGATGAAAAGATAGSLSKTDQKILMDMARANIAEIEAAKIAQSKSQNDQVKSYAQQMIDDHTKALSEVQQVAQAKGVTLPTEPDAKHKAMAAKLEKMSGEAFDKNYMAQAGLSDHKRVLAMLKKDAQRSKDPEVKALADKMTPVVEQHLKSAQQMPAVKTGTTSGK